MHTSFNLWLVWVEYNSMHCNAGLVPIPETQDFLIQQDFLFQANLESGIGNHHLELGIRNWESSSRTF